jgi:hypothetical protein
MYIYIDQRHLSSAGDTTYLPEQRADQRLALCILFPLHIPARLPPRLRSHQFPFRKLLVIEPLYHAMLDLEPSDQPRDWVGAWKVMLDSLCG